MTNIEYWQEVVKDSLTTHGINVDGLIEGMAKDMCISHEQYSTAFGYDVACGNAVAAKDRLILELKQQLLEERRKSTCDTCRGKGHTVMNAGYRSVDSLCSKCRGTGKA